MIHSEKIEDFIINPLKVGDIVKLKSGGPFMTIIKILNKSNTIGSYDCVCQWFNDNPTKLDQGEFIFDTLDKFDPI
jgi:uncharacterized protein YodC (DUF2158 family)